LVGTEWIARRSGEWRQSRTNMPPTKIDQHGFLSGRIAGGTVYGISERPRIFVRTSDPVAAEIARRASLAADSVELGDLFSTDADAVVSAGNGVGHMNAGVDLRISGKFSAGRLEERVRRTIVGHYQGELRIGEAFAIRTRPPDLPMHAGDPEWLIVTPTMSQPRTMVENQLRDTAYRATLAALMKSRSIGVRAVALTTMGAGVGAGSHSGRGVKIEKIKAAIAGMDRAFADFRDIVDDRVSYENALIEYRGRT
jgi:O-acetyl-ADP-ribose deacetylase (regulator of RNase III)